MNSSSRFSVDLIRGDAMVQRRLPDLMKNRIFKNWSLGFAVALMPWAGGCLQQSAIPVETTALSIPSGDNQQTLNAPQPEADLDSSDQTVEPGLSDAPSKLISAQKSPPSNI